MSAADLRERVAYMRRDFDLSTFQRSRYWAEECRGIVEAMLAAALNAQASPQAEPVGEWVMVPREPTLAMLGAGRAKARDGYTLEAAWEAMLAAAPERGGA